jgi:hypothetical protein
MCCYRAIQELIYTVGVLNRSDARNTGAVAEIGKPSDLRAHIVGSLAEQLFTHARKLGLVVLTANVTTISCSSPSRRGEVALPPG